MHQYNIKGKGGRSTSLQILSTFMLQTDCISCLLLGMVTYSYLQDHRVLVIRVKQNGTLIETYVIRVDLFCLFTTKQIKRLYLVAYC